MSGETRVVRYRLTRDGETDGTYRRLKDWRDEGWVATSYEQLGGGWMDITLGRIEDVENDIEAGRRAA